ncbi:hypothetical protein BJX61DRAFT_540821 [Aspergillus egyptiacus]|nr:hypothetical protein BJX61DRAFT_540821 [Aspergillus egyptiacus]
MSEKRDEPSTVPSGTTGTSFSRSSVEDRSSGQSSSESRIDTHDFYRIGGPGCLPEWPVSTGPCNIDPELASTVFDITIDHLRRANIDYDGIQFCTRSTTGRPIVSSDTTLLIKASLDNQHDQLVSVVDDMIQIISGFGYLGRIEIIDPRAVNGIQTFTPEFSEQQQQSWEATLIHIVEVLQNCESDWRQVMPANRGYWKEASRPTVVIKAANLTQQQQQIIRQLREELADKDLQLEVMGTDKLWGLFGALEATVQDRQVRDNLEWPGSNPYHGIGLSVGRSCGGTTSTIGGYLKVERNHEEHIVGLTCYHGIRTSEDGPADPNIDAHGAVGLSWPCQSPSRQDLNIFLEPLQNIVNEPVPTDLPPEIEAAFETKRQDSLKKIQELEEFDASIGNVVAVSGWRNRELGHGLNSPFTFVDWACIELSRARCPLPVNLIQHVRQRLLEEYPEGLPLWKSTKSLVKAIAEVPHEDIAVFKQGRTTGLTAGTLGGLLPAEHRIRELPGHLHHRGYIIFKSPHRSAFSQHGDSGAWCLNGDGDVIGQLVGGDERDGTGIMIPFSTVVDDIELKLGLKPGSVSLP